ncbi:TPA: hypothetical protein SMN72_003508 [Proteus mirabilis]|nr:hypothetical protein [Proteus mirabilis]MBG2887881.1 hypothetical protein [Proteus mirabilis]HAT5558292.1 hypothetical protein [Proteus mirabilis]HBC6377409.1 hypothetical protein [Proteus mirabilis]HBC7365680.1 hypothetical protein [Proteus mirabilis]
MNLKYVGIVILTLSVVFGVYVTSTTGTSYFDRFNPAEGMAYVSFSLFIALIGAIFTGCGFIVEAIDRNANHILGSLDDSKYLTELAEKNKAKKDSDVNAKQAPQGTNHEKIREILKRR